MAISLYLLTSLKGEWETPQEYFDKIDNEFHFEIDVCAESYNAKCKKYFSPEQNALWQKWEGVCWMNPPYGKSISHWIAKAHYSANAGATVVCLLPARTDTKWFHEHILGKAEIRFIKGRMKYGKSKNNAPFPNMLVIFRPPEEPNADQA